MFNFFLPLEKHYDKGFSEVADSFFDAAKSLHPPPEGYMAPHAHLPICYLYRHAIELYLKSGVLIFHRRLKLPYGNRDETKPHVLVNGKWKPLNSTHGIAVLFQYLKSLFNEHLSYLNENTRTNWNLPVKLDELINTVDQMDSISDYFRYPASKAGVRDTEKSSFKKTTVDEVVSQALKTKKPMKSMFTVDNLGQTQEVYVHDDARPLEMLAILSETTQFLSNLNAALMGELGHGW